MAIDEEKVQARLDRAAGVLGAYGIEITDAFVNELSRKIASNELTGDQAVLLLEEYEKNKKVEVLAKELDPTAWYHGLNEPPPRTYLDVRSSEEIWEERRSLARDRAKKIIQNLIDVGEEDSPILEVGDCGQSMIQCLIELESDRSARLVGSSYNSGYVDGWESALDTLRSILIGHGINLKEE